jgi:UDP-glucuronate decarboxylase
VDDLVEGLIRLMETGDGVVGPVNLGNPEEFTIRQLAEIVVDRLRFENSSPPASHCDPKQRQPEISKAQELLGWRPAVLLRVGLTKTAAYFDGLLAQEGAIAVAV